MTPPLTPESANADVPLCVDLDGTLIRTDMLWESLFCFIRQQPGRVLLVIAWLMKGRAHLKRQLAASVSLDVALLPYNEPLLAWLREERLTGRRVILATASDEVLAGRVAAHVGLFDEVIASDGELNLKGRNKAKILQGRFGEAFDYAGNSSSDWEIWRVCRRIIAANTPRLLTGRLEKSGRLARTFGTPKSQFGVWRRALRIHQWIKNVLIFVPVLAAHKALDPGRLSAVLLCFLSFSCVASATYLANDLLDLASDRRHPGKKYRPIASGALGIPTAVLASVVLFVGGIALAAHIGAMWIPLLVVTYAVLSLLYSFSLKKRALLDVYLLSGFYTLRIILGGVAANVPLSGWFLSFSVFLFLSLGFAKRAAELERMLAAGTAPHVPGRGYVVTDFHPVMCFGIASAFASALVLLLYFQSPDVQILYRHPKFLWPLFPISLYWLTRVWLLASRGILHDDPISFAVKDRLTWLLIALCAITLKLAA